MKIAGFLLAAALLWTAAPPSAPAADTPAAPAAAADRWGYSALPKPAADEAPAAPVADNSAYIEKLYWDRKEERAFKFNALIALSCTMAGLYLIAAFMLFRLSERARGQHIVHLTSLSLIVYGALALALVPTTSESLTAPIGILGALAGYLFGHVAPKGEGKDEPEAKAKSGT